MLTKHCTASDEWWCPPSMVENVLLTSLFFWPLSKEGAQSHGMTWLEGTLKIILCSSSWGNEVQRVKWLEFSENMTLEMWFPLTPLPLLCDLGRVTCSLCSGVWLCHLGRTSTKHGGCDREITISTSGSPYRFHVPSTPGSSALGLLGIPVDVHWIRANSARHIQSCPLSPTFMETPGTADGKPRDRHLTLGSPIHRLVICLWHGLVSDTESVVVGSRWWTWIQVAILEFVQK